MRAVEYTLFYSVLLLHLTVSVHSCPTAAWKDWNGNCYLFVDQLLSFNDALDYCATLHHADITVVGCIKIPASLHKMESCVLYRTNYVIKQHSFT